MPRRSLALALAAGLGLAVLSAGAPASAQPSLSARAAAAALFEDGKRLMSENKYAEACPKLEESQRVDPGMGTLYQLSVCYEAVGRTASAWVGFREVAGLALAAGQADRERAARGKASALETKLMRLKITVQAANTGTGVEVKRDGAVISPALWGTPVPLDPGKHKVSAAGPDKDPWEVTVQLDQPGATINVEVPPLQDRKPGVVPPPPPPGDVRPPSGDNGAPPPPPQPPPVEGRPHRSWMTPVGIAATVVGAGGLAGGVALGFVAKSSFNASNSGTPPNCDSSNKCNTAGLGQRSTAVSQGNIGTGLFIGGAVVAAAGIVLWIAAPSSQPARTGTTPSLRTARERFATPQIGLGPTGVSLRGAW
jgi:serine/threonine-protein kinase